MKKLVFIFLSIFLVLNVNNTFGDYSWKPYPLMTDSDFLSGSENLISDVSDINWTNWQWKKCDSESKNCVNIASFKPICSESEYNISTTIWDAEKYKIQSCGKKIASKIISLNNTAITTTNSYRKQLRNDYLSWALIQRKVNFSTIKKDIPWYKDLSESSLYFNFKPLLKDSIDSNAYKLYSTIISANASVSWSLAEVNKYLKEFQLKKMELYYSYNPSPSSFSEYGITTSNINTNSLISYKDKINTSINNMKTKLIDITQTWWINATTNDTAWLLFKSHANFNKYMTYLSASLIDSLDTQINELQIAWKYKVLSEQLYPSNEALLSLIRQLYLIENNVSDLIKNKSSSNSWAIFNSLKEGIMSWFTPTISYSSNSEKLFPISSSTYEISPNLSNNKKAILGKFIDDNLLITGGKFYFNSTGLNKLSNSIYNNNLRLSESFDYIKKISKSFVKSGSRYVTTNLD